MPACTSRLLLPLISSLLGGFPKQTKSELMSVMKSSSTTTGEQQNHIKGIVTHARRYIQYNVYDNLFEVSRKYFPPICPVGRGTYGIVCTEVVMS
ncbi:hypothetical protein L2E82_32329 [Cichorium intybus]|uniref:Uncharacterized protein n=1 Tax=Cichorium intybus TaxID=13427 RepID=A0ACB9BH71_CICIN|nr:hypothetical protein L2E82_32329 [Cichorium intybus]